MRAAYREQLDNFSHDLIIMSTTVHKLMALASQALIKASLQPAEEAVSLRDELDEVRSRCEDRAVSLLALENPMAKDLRQVISSIYIVEDFYRMGRLSQHIATSARRRHPEMESRASIPRPSRAASAATLDGGARRTKSAHAAPASAAAAPPWPVRLGPPLSAVAALCSDKCGGGGVRGESD